MLNLGILAHVDAGKTTLTERLLYAAGAIDEIGSVDAGSTRTDTLALERRRGITIRSAVVSFTVRGTAVNLIDTPGHPDFIAEVERALGVLDAAVLVVSGVEGVQAQTRVLFRALRRLRLPALLFVNKLDRPTADRERTLAQITARLTPAAAPVDRAAEVVAANDEALLAAYVDGTLTPAAVRAALVAQTARALESVVEPLHAADRGRLHAALVQLAEQDPLIGLRDGGVVSLYGEVQKEVIQATLAEDFGVEATFRETTTIHVERVQGSGAAVETIDEGENPFLATVGLRVAPGPVGGGTVYGLEVELGSMPSAFMRAVERSVAEALRAGLYGWEVLDARVTLTHSGYWARQSHSHGTFDKSMSSTAGDFRALTPLVLRAALERAGTRVEEPLHAFRLELPGDTVGAVLPVLSRLRAVAHRATPGLLTGELPAAHVHELRRRLPALTRGEGYLESEFARYAPVRGRPPRRSGGPPRSPCSRSRA